MSLRRICRAHRVIQHPETSICNQSTAGHQPANRSEGGADGRLKSPWSTAYGRRIWLYGYPIIAALAGLLIGLFAGYSAEDATIARQPSLPSMTQCVADTLNLFSQRSPPNSETLRDAREHCYSLIQGQGVLSDFAIRRLNFFQQYRANGVLMWMVVAVTLSGVVLAGFQLWASYKLAAANKASLHGDAGELTLKRDQLVLKSSITGLFILVLSFCFFLVFIFYVYRFEAATNGGNLASPPVPTLPMGGLGPPRTETGKP
jgi:hypothetical protein